MVLIERLAEIKRLWYKFELPVRQDIAYIYLDPEQRIIKDIDERLENLLENRDFWRFLKRLKKEHEMKEISEIERIFSKKYKRENPETWHEEAQEGIIELFKDILPDIRAFESYKKTRHEQLRFKNEVPWALRQAPKAGITKRLKIAIIGAGFSGLAAAYFQLKSGVKGSDIVILEKETVGAGSSGRSGAFLTASVETDFVDEVKDHGRKTAVRYWRSAEYGIELIKEIADDIAPGTKYLNYNIGYLYLTEDEETLEVFGREKYALGKILGNKAVIIQGSELEKRFNLHGYLGALYSHKASYMYPVGFINEMHSYLVKNGVRIMEKTEVASIDKNNTAVVLSNGTRIEAEAIIAASNYSIVNFGVPRNLVEPVETYLALTEPLPAEFLRKHNMLFNHIMWDSEEIYTYFTILDDGRILVGGRDKNFSHNSRLPDEVKFKQEFYKYLVTHFPNLHGIRFQKMWSGVIAGTPDMYPYIGRIKNSNLYISLSNGIPYCFLAGKIIADLMRTGTSEYADLFALDRKISASTSPFAQAMSTRKPEK